MTTEPLPELPDPKKLLEEGKTPWEVSQIRRKVYKETRQTGWVEIDGDARVPDDDLDLAAEAEEAHAAAEGSQDEVVATHHGFEIKIPENLLVVHFTMKVPEGLALEDQKRLLLRKFQEAATYYGFEPVLAVAKEMKASDLANSGGELGAAARTVGVRGS